MFRFASPLFLLGLLAIVVPLVLHLLFRRRVPIVDFPLARLIAKAEKTRQPRKHLNRVLLLIARSLALALLALALARLTVGGRVVSASGPVSVVIVLDDSLSMRARDADGVSAFETGKQGALRFLDALPEGSMASLVTTSEPSLGEKAGLRSELAQVRAALEQRTCTLRHVPLADACEAAVRMLETSPVPDRRMVLVSDMAHHAFKGMEWSSRDEAPFLVELVDPVPIERGLNRSVSGLAAATLPDGRLGVTAQVSAWGKAATDIPAELRTGIGRQQYRLAGRAQLSPGAGAAAERRFEVAPPGEGFAGVELSIARDFLREDDVRHAVAHVARRLKVGVVDGDPQNLSFGSETFYVERALAPGVGLDFEAELLTLADIATGELEFDVLLLCNVPELTPERSLALTEAVNNGMGLIVALGNRVVQPVYNGRLAGVLPATLGLARQGEKLQVSTTEGDLYLPRVATRGWFDLTPDEGSEIVARLENGKPLVVEGQAGAGRVILLATTVDRDWTDLPISPHFLPFLHDLIGRVSARHQFTVLPPQTMGSTLDLAPLVDERSAWVVSPGGERRALPVDGQFTVPEEPGVHEVEIEGAVEAAFSAVTNVSESDLTPLSAEEIGLALAPTFHVPGRDTGDSGSSQGGHPAWKMLLLLLVGLNAVESWLARRAA